MMEDTFNFFNGRGYKILFADEYDASVLFRPSPSSLVHLSTAVLPVAGATRKKNPSALSTSSSLRSTRLGIDGTFTNLVVRLGLGGGGGEEGIEENKGFWTGVRRIGVGDMVRTVVRCSIDAVV